MALSEPVGLEPVAAVAEAVLSFGWSEDVPPEPGPVVHLRLGLSHAGQAAREVEAHVEEGRLAVAACGSACGADLTGTLDLDLRGLLDLLDPTTPDPLMAVLAQPTRIDLPFDALLYVGGVAEAWVPALRQAVPPDLVDACRAHLAGLDARDADR